MAYLVYTSDVHGDLELYRAAGEVALRRQADAVVIGGDLCPGTPSALDVHLPWAQPEFLLSQIGPLVESWKQMRSALRVFVIPGNDDCQTVLPALNQLQERGLVEDLHLKAVPLGAYTFVGLSFVPPTPFSIKDFERLDGSSGDGPCEPQISRCVIGTPRGFQAVEDFQAYLTSRPTIEEELDRLPGGDPERTIAVVHCPPFRTRCDVLYNGQHIGSAALRRWIERYQPLLTLHGHIHESPRLSGAFFDRIGRTIVVNPGASGRRPHLVLINLEDLSELEHSVYGRRRV